jgi:UDP-glucose 4-epimerase
VPKALFRHRIPILPLPNDLVLQFVHSDDVADALVRILRQRLHGPVNLVAEPVVTPGVLAEILGGRHLPVPPWLVRLLANITWRLRLQPTPPGWVDLALTAPLLDASRARTELDWQPRFGAQETLEALVRGIGEGKRVPASPVL